MGGCIPPVGVDKEGKLGSLEPYKRLILSCGFPKISLLYGGSVNLEGP